MWSCYQSRLGLNNVVGSAMDKNMENSLKWPRIPLLRYRSGTSQECGRLQRGMKLSLKHSNLEN